MLAALSLLTVPNVVHAVPPWHGSDPEPLDERPPPPRTARPPPSGATSDQEPIDVLVLGDRRVDEEEPAVERELSDRDVERLPGAFGDAFRAVEVMPGVVPLASGVPHLFVRGAPPAASGYYIDDIRVPFLFHLAIGPSVVNPLLLDDVTFYPGAYPARFGRHVGGIVAAQTRAPSELVRAEGSIRLFDAGAYLEVPTLDGDLSAFAAGRYSYTAPLLSLIAPSTRLHYWDYQGGASIRTSARDRVQLFALGSGDHLGSVQDDIETTQFAAEFHRIRVSLEHRPMAGRARDEPSGPEDASARVAFIFGIDKSTLGSDADLLGRNYALRTDVQLPIVRWLSLRGGFDVLVDEFEFEDLAAGDPTARVEDSEFHIAEAFETRTVGTAGAYLDAVLRAAKWVEVVPGIRADVFEEHHEAKVGVDPRGMVRVHPVDWLSVTTAGGFAHQRPALLISIPGVEPVGLADGLQRAIQLSHGFEVELPERIGVGVTGFYHHYDNLSDLTTACGAGVRDCRSDDRSEGRAWGMELMMKRSLSERVGGLLSYTLSRAERREGASTFLSDFDRTHVLNTALGVDLGRNWHVGARFTVYSGRPYSIVRFDEPARPTVPTLVGKRNALRRSPFHRFDLRVEKRWVIAERGWISLVLEGFNVTARKEIVDVDCRVAEVAGDAGPSCKGEEFGPIAIPSLGVAGGI